MAGKPLLMDVDTGVDDAMALALATRLDGYELTYVTTVAGNVPVETATHNTLRVLSWTGVDVPVHRGMSRPLVRKLWTATEFHGDDGLGGWEAPEAELQVSGTTAPEAIVQLAREHSGSLVCAFVGPLTNLAVALGLEPQLPEMIDRLVIMGGAFHNPGNVTEHAEFNVFVDPEAAAIVATSNFNATWIGLDVTHQTLMTRDVWDSLGSSTDPASVLIYEVCRHGLERRARQAVALHDPLAIAVVENPELVDLEGGLVTVDLSEDRRGATRLANPIDSEPRSRIAVDVDVGNFNEIFGRLMADR